MTTEEKNIPTNKKLVAKIAELFQPMPNPVPHGYFNRLMFLEAFIVKAGMGVSITAEDIMKHAGVTPKEFPFIEQEFISEGLILKEKNMYEIVMYRLNDTVKNEVQSKAEEIHKETMKAAQSNKEAI